VLTRSGAGNQGEGAPITLSIYRNQPPLEGRGSPVRIRPLSLFAPIVIAASILLVAPPAVLAANGMTETGTTTYEVVPSKSVITVTVKLSIYNGKPDTVTSTGSTYYYWNATSIAVENEAGPVKVTSNAGGVSQTTTSTDQYYRYIKLIYPNVYYGQTRVVTATYSIPAGPHAPGGYRAGSAYVSLCAIGNGYDTGSVSVVVPTGFDLYVDYGSQLDSTGTSGGNQVFSSGTQASPYKFWTCVDGEDPANLTHTSLTASGQTFDIEGWPEDTTWKAAVQEEVGGDVQRLEDLTGLTMPGGTIKIVEAGDMQLGEYGGVYNSLTHTASIPESAEKDIVAHELSHVWFNRTTLTDKWMSEGLAGYSEKASGPGNYTACKDPGAYPGKGSPDLTTWMTLTNNSSTQDQKILDWQYSAACYIFTSVANSTGPAYFKAVLAALSANEMAYTGGEPGEQLADVNLPATSKQLLDLIDERGMVPAGFTDDTTQNLLAKYGIFDTTTLAARSTARAAYHSLVTAAGKWKLPLAIRGPMSSWGFAQAGTAMDTAKQVIGIRDSIAALVPGLSLDGTVLQKKFESAATQADLADLLTLIKKEADAAAKVDQATKLRNGSRSILQTIGLLGADLETPLTGARTDLQNIKTDSAVTQAQSVIDLIDNSNDQGMMRAGAVAAALGLLLVLIALIVLLLRRRKRAVAPTGPAAPFYAYPPPDYDPATGAPLWPPAGPPAGELPPAPPAPPAGEWPPTAPPPAEAGAWQPPEPTASPPAGEWPPAPPAAPTTGPEAEPTENVDPPTG